MSSNKNSKGINRSSSIYSLSGKDEIVEVQEFQDRLKAEGERILNCLLPQKIGQMCRLCEDELFLLKNIELVKKETKDSINKYQSDLEEAEEGKGGLGGNPLLALLGAAAASKAKAKEEAGEGDDHQELDDDYFDAEEEQGQARNLLMEKISLAEDNKINLTLSLGLELPESMKARKKRQLSEDESAAEETPAKKSKSEDNPKNSSPESEKEDSDKTKKNKKKSGKKGKKQTRTEELQAEDSCSESDNVSDRELKAVESHSSESGLGMSKKESNEPSTENVSESASNTKKESKKEARIEVHSHITKIIDLLKPEIDQICDWLATLRAWILTCMSRNKNIGGADFQGDIQQEIIAEIKGVEDEFLSYKEVCSAYYVTRAGILGKALKEPELQDYTRFIVEEDEKMFVTLRQAAFALRNQTMNLYDAITQDADKVFSAPTQHRQSMAMY